MDYQAPVQIPMSSPDLTEAESEAVLKVVRSSQLSMGAYIEAFEKAFCDFTGCQHAIAVNSGTAGLHLCIRAAGIETGDLVITTPFSFVASTNAILYERGIPIYVDVDPITANIDPQKVIEAINALTSNTKRATQWLPRKGAASKQELKAILTVDVFGQPADYDPIQQIASQKGLVVINDACEALGAAYKGRKAGTLGEYGVFAFYPNKQITTAEGGIIVTNNDKAATYMRALRNQGRAPGDTWLQHTYLGYNYRLDEMSAALGTVQMSRLDELLTKRQNVANWYNQRLQKIPSVQVPALAATTTTISWFVYVIRLADGLNRDLLASQLKEKGIPVRPYFLPIHLQPYMVERFGYQPGDFPITEDLGKRCLALPFSGKMSEQQVEFVCEELQNCIDRQ